MGLAYNWRVAGLFSTAADCHSSQQAGKGLTVSVVSDTQFSWKADAIECRMCRHSTWSAFVHHRFRKCRCGVYSIY
jgi:hypothetical protein